MRFLKGLLTTAAVVSLAGTALAEGELHIYNWGNYTNPELVKKFEEAYGVEVTIDDYDSNETMLAKVRAGNPGYDIVVPTDYTVKIMIEEGLLAETTPSGMENFKNVDPKWVDVYFDEGRSYTVPWQWGTTTFAVDTAVYDGDINTYAILLEPPEALVDKINMQPDMYEVMNAALRYLGKPLCNGNPDDLKAAYALLKEAKPKWRTIEYGMIQPLVSGDIAASQGWNGATMRAREQKSTIKYAYPKEGFSAWMDNVAVLKDAPNMENAKLFQNFIMDPENAALISDFAKYANGIKGSEAFLPAEFISAPEITIPEGAPTPVFVPLCPKDVQDKYSQIWTNLLK